jgi:hypothetical protein
MCDPAPWPNASEGGQAGECGAAPPRGCTGSRRGEPPRTFRAGGDPPGLCPCPPGLCPCPAGVRLGCRGRLRGGRSSERLSASLAPTCVGNTFDATADAWSGRDVLVAMRDVRWPTLGVWLAAQDVRRRRCQLNCASSPSALVAVTTSLAEARGQPAQKLAAANGIQDEDRQRRQDDRGEDGGDVDAVLPLERPER